MLEVHILMPNQETKIFDVADDNFIIGRGKSSRVQISSEHVSRSHLKVICVGNDIHLQDFTSTNWVYYNGEKLDKEQAVQYSEDSTCYLPGKIQVKFFHKDATRIDLVKHELTMINFNIKKLISKTVQDEIAEIEMKESRGDDFFGRSEMEIHKLKVSGVRAKTSLKLKSRKVVQKIPFRQKYPNVMVFSQLGICSILIFGFFFMQNLKKEKNQDVSLINKVHDESTVRKPNYVKGISIEPVRVFSNSRDEFLANLNFDLKFDFFNTTRIIPLLLIKLLSFNRLLSSRISTKFLKILMFYGKTLKTTKNQKPKPTH